MKTLLRALLACLAAPLFAAPAVDSSLAAARTKSATALARADLADYRGWIKYLRLLADTAVARHGAASPEATEAIHQLDDWTDRILANPHLLATLTGVQEWAYESPVDGSGQPFKLVIPTDYDPAHPAPLSVYMHGYSGNHLEHTTGWTPHPGSFDVAVLGRSRGGGYRALSEADVLQVIDYIEAHWSIDRDRVSLNGGSMGGGGTYRLGSRYPQRFSSGRPACGFASWIPVGNLLTLPIYATHSADDPVVSVLHERGPLARLRALGGQVIFDETDGFGHAVWDYAAGNERGAAWEKHQMRPPSRDVRHIDYTALDGAAVRGWWAEIAEWGDAPAPAHFVLTVGADNTLYADLANIAALRLFLAESPLDRAQPLHVSIDGAVPLTLAAPLPDRIVLVHGETGWSFAAAPAPAPFRLHTPGSANLLYDGEPLLIVYGTRGSEAIVHAMRAAAESASKSPNAAWVTDGGQAGTDGVPHSQNLYGHLVTKADTAVTDADLARCHLVLIGTAAQNAVVARLAAQLPVTFADGTIACRDGLTLPAAHRALGLVHYDPLAPDRLIFWVASDDPATYAANSPVARFMDNGGFSNGTPFGADFVVTDAASFTLVAARSFDSRWHWQPDRASSPLLPASLATHREFAAGVGAALRRASGADFALLTLPADDTDNAIEPGTTRLSDVLPLYYYAPVGTFELTGAELKSLHEQIATTAPNNLAQTHLGLFAAPALDPAKLDPARHYLVALSVDALWDFSALAKLAPPSYRLTDLDLGTVVGRFLLSPK